MRDFRLIFFVYSLVNGVNQSAVKKLNGLLSAETFLLPETE